MKACPMIFHTSIAADNPEAAAKFFAKLWNGRAYPFPPFADGSWIAMAGDERNSAIEVYPRGSQMHWGDRDSIEVQNVAGAPVREAANHSAIASPLSAEEVLACAADAGIPARVCNRGPFRVIEVWIDGCTMFEVLPPDMQAEYIASMTFEGWEAYLEAA